jgi:hypothetical protein
MDGSQVFPLQGVIGVGGGIRSGIRSGVGGGREAGQQGRDEHGPVKVSENRHEGNAPRPPGQSKFTPFGPISSFPRFKPDSWSPKARAKIPKAFQEIYPGSEVKVITPKNFHEFPPLHVKRKQDTGAPAFSGPDCCGARAGALGLTGARPLAHSLRIPGAESERGHFLSRLAS